MREDVASAIYKGKLVRKVDGRPAVLGHLTRRSRFSLNNDLVDQRWTTVEKIRSDYSQWCAMARRAIALRSGDVSSFARVLRPIGGPVSASGPNVWTGCVS